MRHENLIKNFERLKRWEWREGGGSQQTSRSLPARAHGLGQCFPASVALSIWRPCLPQQTFVKTLPRCHASCQAPWVHFDTISAAQKRDGCEGGTSSLVHGHSPTVRQTKQVHTPGRLPKPGPPEETGLLWLLRSDVKQGKTSAAQLRPGGVVMALGTVCSNASPSCGGKVSQGLLGEQVL